MTTTASRPAVTPHIDVIPLVEDDLIWLWHWNVEVPGAEWKHWDGPYFGDIDDRDYEEFAEEWRPRLAGGDRALITVEGHRCGFVNRFEEPPAGGGWWELGIVIFEPELWGRGIGRAALGQWVDQTLRETCAQVLTLATWSGNARMIGCARTLGFTECGRVPGARYWDGRRWDQVTMALSRD